MSKYDYEKIYSEIMGDISNKVKVFRKQNSITNKQLAEDLGITTSLVSRIESGNKNISIKTLSKVLAKMGCTIEIKKNKD